MKLYIAEKPSLARAIVAALPKPHKKDKTHITAGNGDVVTWCIGHILEQANPEDYDEIYKKWQMVHLPIIPQQWQLKPKSKTRGQLSAIRKLVKQANDIIHAGDPDREGQLLVDEVIHYVKVSKQKQQRIKRLLISDLNLSAVKRALASLKSNQDFVPLSVSALARSRADWLYGINLTRTYTLLGQKAGYHGVLSVGRVQTPILGLVANRDKAIEDFTPHTYYQILAHIVTPSNDNFQVKWIPSEACKAYLDENNRLLHKPLAENIINRISNQPAHVLDIESKENKRAAPLPYNLSALQIDAAKRYSMNAKLVLDVCQSLYEKHKLITYPRSDCRYLPKEQHSDAVTIIKQFTTTDHPLAEFAKQADASISSKAFNSKKVTAHHAIIPTARCVSKVTLNPFEANIYQLIMRQYLAQFFPAYIYLSTKIILEIAGGKFSALANVNKQLGWKIMFPQSKQKKKNEREEKANLQVLPELNIGDVLHCQSGELIEKETQAPAHFTDATLLAAITGIANHVKDIEIKKILKDTDGLGTEATRAGIIELLFKRQFLKRVGKNITATQVGRALITALPEKSTLPDMTALWESQLEKISTQQLNYQSFIRGIQDNISQLIYDVKDTRLSGLPQNNARQSFVKKRRKKKAIA